MILKPTINLGPAENNQTMKKHVHLPDTSDWMTPIDSMAKCAFYQAPELLHTYQQQP